VRNSTPESGMMENVLKVVDTTRYFKSALGLLAAILLVELSALFYIFMNRGALPEGSFLLPLSAMVILFGIWVQSGVVRYLGALWLVVTLGLIVWAVLSHRYGLWNFWFAGVWIVGSLHLATLWILLLSRRFSVEFAHLRDTQPVYKKILRRLSDAVLIIATTAATLADVYHFASF
jgi:hypothetical protein